MNEDANFILNEKKCNLLMVWNTFSILVHYKCSGFFTGILNDYPPLIVSQDGKLSTATLK